jgi:hypothetical protein
MRALPLLFGLDLGQAQDYTALAVAQQVQREGRREYHLRHVRRWDLGTPYTAPENGIVEDLAELIDEVDEDVALVVDATGCGRPVVDMIRKAKLGVRQLIPVVITAGHAANCTGGYWHVPKRDLVGATASLLQSRRLLISSHAKLGKVLRQEMRTFSVKMSLTTGHESFEAWREREHDDCVLAAALCCWYGEKCQRRLVVGF